jgi:hypothetical protein
MFKPPHSFEVLLLEHSVVSAENGLPICYVRAGSSKDVRGQPIARRGLTTFCITLVKESGEWQVSSDLAEEH